MKRLLGFFLLVLLTLSVLTEGLIGLNGARVASAETIKGSASRGAGLFPVSPTAAQYQSTLYKGGAVSLSDYSGKGLILAFVLKGDKNTLNFLARHASRFRDAGVEILVDVQGLTAGQSNSEFDALVSANGWNDLRFACNAENYMRTNLRNAQNLNLGDVLVLCMPILFIINPNGQIVLYSENVLHEDEEKGIVEAVYQIAPNPIQVSGLSFPEPSATLVMHGGSMVFSASVSPPNATNNFVTYSIDDTSIAEIGDSGSSVPVYRVAGVAPGVTTLRATAHNGKSASMTIIVEPLRVQGVYFVSEDVLTLEKGKSFTFTENEVWVWPWNATNRSVTWKSDDAKIATVDASGKVTGISGGTTTITATTVDGGYTARHTVVVTSRVTGVSLNKRNLSLDVGQYDSLVASVSPEDATNKNVKWTSSNEQILRSMGDGRIFGVAAGTATITATTEDGARSASCVVSVVNKTIAVTGIRLNYSVLNLGVGGRQTLKATVLPENATNVEVAWKSSDATVATVDALGNVTGIKPGRTTVTCTAKDGSGAYVTCEISVANGVAVTGVALDKNTVKITAGKTLTLKTAIAPENASNKHLTWKTSNGKIAKVNESGKITGVKAGKATITVTTEDGDKSASCAVTVVSPVKSIAVAQITVYIKKGTSAKLGAVAVTTDQSKAALKWKSSAPKVVSVDKNGKVKALKSGKAKITVSADNGKSASITVKVSGRAPTAVSIKNPPKKKTMKVGDELRLSVIAKPGNAQGAISFKSSKPSILFVDASGKLRALKPGKATITVKMGKKQTTLEITVKR